MEQLPKNTVLKTNAIVTTLYIDIMLTGLFSYKCAFTCMFAVSCD